MATEFEIVPEQALIHMRMSEVLTNQEAFELQTAIRQHPDFSAGYSELVDIRDVTRNEVTGDAMVQMARESANEDGTKRAIIVSNDTDYGLSKLFRLLAQHNPEVTEIFWNMKDAREWLGLPPEAGE